ncbi:dTMP kinase [Sulfuriferula sp.]|uniref:dTMP kinase n=1 Tax=Sulfuriferula sp. TaxID=2025307 RepID=UPI002730D662|nr:dTMP kinase [Sulfuriferula sp.]MDP2026494.1 dTMP kinase [Sulfuriferula sp.]
MPFITLEGIDGAGKSTHLAWLAEQLRARGDEVVVTREPGGTPLGEALRGLLLSEPMHIETEALLMFAARREHLDRVILPALARGAYVISDRFTDASFAYQCGGRGIDEDKLRVLEDWVQDGLQPDLTLLFDVEVAIASQRLAGNGNLDRFEQEKKDFFERVRAQYLRRAQQYPARFRIINGACSIEQIRDELAAILNLL